MFVRILAFHCDQCISYEITMNDHQARKISKIKMVIFGLQLWETYYLDHNKRPSFLQTFHKNLLQVIMTNRQEITQVSSLIASLFWCWLPAVYGACVETHRIPA